MTISYDMPAREYMMARGLSNSVLSSFAISPAHCWALHYAPDRPKREPTPAMRAGTLTHCVVLEPYKFSGRYAVKPDALKLSTKDGIAWAAAVPEGVEIITADQMRTAESQRAAVLAVPELKHALTHGRTEVSAFWTDQATGTRCKARPDLVQPLKGKQVRVLDLKTAADMTPDGFARAVATMGYHRQQAHYTAGLKACGFEVAEFIFGVVSNSYPYIAAAYVLDDDAAAQGAEEVAELIDKYAACKASDFWPAFGDSARIISLPRWARRETEIEVSYVQA